MTCMEDLNAGFGAWLGSPSPQAQWLAGMTRKFRQEEILVFAFGGMLRDLALGRDPRDLDLVCDSMMWEQIQPLVKPWLKRTNRFGGLKLEVPKVGEVDLWPVRNTHAFSQGLRNLRSPLRLPETVTFNIEAAVLECTEVEGRRMGAENGFFSGLALRTIDFITVPVIPDPCLAAARAGVMAEKLDFKLSSRLAGWCRKVADEQGWEAIGQVGHRHYGDRAPESIVQTLQAALRPQIPSTGGVAALASQIAANAPTGIDRTR
jgi:hypothetical protein